MRMQLSMNRAVELSELFVTKNIFFMIGDKSNLDSYTMNPQIEVRMRTKINRMIDSPLSRWRPFPMKVMSAINEILMEEFDSIHLKPVADINEYTFLFAMMLINNTKFGKQTLLKFEDAFDSYLEYLETVGTT